MSNNNGYDDDDPNESVEMLRERVNRMKYLLSERNSMQSSDDGSNANNNNNNNNGNANYQRRDDPQQWTRSSTAVRHSGIINGQFLSVVLCVTLVVIVSVAFYAFYNLYNAVLKKFPSQHTEL